MLSVIIGVQMMLNWDGSLRMKPTMYTQADHPPNLYTILNMILEMTPMLEKLHW
jgi:hypothetical protein